MVRCCDIMGWWLFIFQWPYSWEQFVDMTQDMRSWIIIIVTMCILLAIHIIWAFIFGYIFIVLSLFFLSFYIVIYWIYCLIVSLDYLAIFQIEWFTMQFWFWGRKWANVPFKKKKIQHFVQFLKLIKEMPFFWNSIISKLSYKKKFLEPYSGVLKSL